MDKKNFEGYLCYELLHFCWISLQLSIENDDVRDPQSDAQKRHITSDQKKYLDAQIAARSIVNPSAANMRKMVTKLDGQQFNHQINVMFLNMIDFSINYCLVKKKSIYFTF